MVKTLDKRQERLSSVTNNLVSAMGAIGINLTETFQRGNYLRHQVLEYANPKEVSTMLIK